LGRIAQIAYSDQVQAFGYDAQGNISRIDDGSGSTVYARDALGRVLAKTQTVNDVPGSPGKYIVRYGYTQGDLTSIKYPSGLQVTYQRAAGRITEVDVQPPPGVSGNAKPVIPLVTGLMYTALGQARSWSWFNGDSASRSFDADGRMTANEFARYGFDAAGRITSITQNLWAAPDGRRTAHGKPKHRQGELEVEETPITWAISYDSRNRVSGMSRAGQSTTFTYDANSNRLSKLEIATSDVDLEGQFDGPGQSLTASETPKIDPGSNRLLGVSVFATVDGDRKRSTTSTSQLNYAVDASGNMTSDGQRTFVYDASNRLVKVEAVNNGDAVGVEYLHNALGQRVFKSDVVAEQNSSNKDRFGTPFLHWLTANFGWLFDQRSKSRLGLVFVYDEQGNLIASYSDGSSSAAAQQMELIWLPLEDGTSIPVGVYKGGQFYAVHTDHLGTPRLITDNTKAQVWQWPYSAFGSNKPTGLLQTIVTTSKVATSTQLRVTKPELELNLRLPGQYVDSESELAYNWWRYYASMGDGYIQMDPVGLQGGMNRRVYVKQNPLSQFDRTGLQAYNGQTPPENIPGGPWTPAGEGQRPGTFYGPKNSSVGPRNICRYVPDASNDGPTGAKQSYWKTQTPGQEGWSRFDQNGNPMTPEQAHPSSSPSAPAPFTVPGSFPLYPLLCPLCRILFPTYSYQNPA
jgi:RHS repeat-associated protein